MQPYSDMYVGTVMLEKLETMLFHPDVLNVESPHHS